MAKSIARERRMGFRAQPTSPARVKLYERDMYRWTRQQARLLRAGRMSELDLENLAEEIESLGNRDYRELRSRITLILMHLLEWKFQPERRTRGWLTTIVTQRQDIEGALAQSPSLRRHVPLMFEKVYVDAVRQAVAETGLPQSAFPASSPVTVEQALDPDFMPKD